MDSDSGSDCGGDAPHFPRDLPNILITGTPGTGKTTTSEMAAEATGLTHINVGDLVKAKTLHEGLDKEYDTYILDEDKVDMCWSYIQLRQETLYHFNCLHLDVAYCLDSQIAN